MSSKTVSLDEVGDLAAEPGSRPWAIAVKGEIQSALHDVEFGAEQLSAWVRLMEDRQGYAALGFPSFETFCETPPPAGLGKNRISISIEIDNRRLAQHGGDHKSKAYQMSTENQHDNYKLDSFGTDSTYLTARIARDRPDILERMRAGEYRSVRAAAIEAGIVKPEKRISIPVDPAGAARLILRHFTAEQIAALIDALIAE